MTKCVLTSEELGDPSGRTRRHRQLKERILPRLPQQGLDAIEREIAVGHLVTKFDICDPDNVSDEEIGDAIAPAIVYARQERHKYKPKD